MKKAYLAVAVVAGIVFASCNPTEQQTGTNTDLQQEITSSEAEASGGQSSVVDNESQKNVVQVAATSPDHTTLVTAVKTAGLVDVLTNAGPFTVFAPTNAAFEKLPAGTVEGLLKPEKRGDLRNILQYHVYVGVLNADSFEDGQSLGQVNGGRITMGVKDGKVTVNGANIVASIPTSNGVIHVVDQVLLPQ
ncbi:fasciclin domain-containing protein [Pontibacter cellulosilyticus]|uniref:Fasciclin domain-containing protein n=1 Tax=Pontibacter cellulosilyticus TaxID=1720253 RepID=A0A923N5C2_9BACT|nr:fasciclin domain-containing protein [Pontibacter cellulosilyticus]MBC5992878.1 fasciclin domain-containing protein [Pontibacter cellulosilyticus]